ncbi:hypothetical protein NM688_g2971 [Phlebia brevispora]|uniref:Uncharacterized protein n=1 Tax=Phlebia brevispora TaxID=194682 RepID=A0ACC1T6U0_9APHY|nr:hypothetical protein NM688_g2971 [Phlebia brevispora]
MPPKRKSDALDDSVVDALKDGEEQKPEAKARPTKKTRVSKAANASASTSNPDNTEKTGVSPAASASAPKSWRDIVLEIDADGSVPVYDDCNEIRRKIRLLQKESDFKITHWLKEIGNINSNSFQRFMKAKGPTGGASNGTYYAAYVFFEKKRIFEGKKKTPTRTRNESQHPNGFELREHRYVWVPPR